MAEEQPIVIRKILKGHAGHHGGAWKVAYADFVTAMMALFMVLWIMSQGPEVRQQVAAYFTDPRGVPVLPDPTSSIMENRGVGMMDNLPNPTPPLDRSGEGTGPKYMRPMNPTEQEQLDKAGKKIMKQILARPELSKLTDMMKVVVTHEGLRIELSDQVEGTFFDVGSAQPKPVLDQVLTEIVAVLSEMDHEVAVEGHTDSRPYARGLLGYSNWELSADRANTVRKMMTVKGLVPARIAEVRAYADQNPLPGTDPLDGRNRRVSILVKAKGASVQVADQAADLSRPDTSGLNLAEPAAASEP